MWIAIYLTYDDMSENDEEPSVDECVYAQSLTGDSLALLKVSLNQKAHSQLKVNTISFL